MWTRQAIGRRRRMSGLGIVRGILVRGWEGAGVVDRLHVALGWIGVFRTRRVHVGMIRTS